MERRDPVNTAAGHWSAATPALFPLNTHANVQKQKRAQMRAPFGRRGNLKDCLEMDQRAVSTVFIRNKQVDGTSRPSSRTLPERGSGALGPASGFILLWRAASMKWSF